MYSRLILSLVTLFIALSTSACANPFEEQAKAAYEGYFKSEGDLVRILSFSDGDNYVGEVWLNERSYSMQGRLTNGALYGQIRDGKKHYTFQAVVTGDELEFTNDQWSGKLNRAALPELKGHWESPELTAVLEEEGESLTGFVMLGETRYPIVAHKKGNFFHGELVSNTQQRGQFSLERKADQLIFKAGNFRISLSPESAANKKSRLAKVQAEKDRIEKTRLAKLAKQKKERERIERLEQERLAQEAEERRRTAIAKRNAEMKAQRDALLSRGIAAKYDVLPGRFQDGLAAVGVEKLRRKSKKVNDKDQEYWEYSYAFIDLSGNTVISNLVEPKRDDFLSELGILKDFINQHLDPNLYPYFSCGFAQTRIGKGDETACIDANGKVVWTAKDVKARFAWSYSDGMSKVSFKEKGDDETFGFVNTEGKVIKPYFRKWNAAGNYFGEGLNMVKPGNGNDWIIINKDGKKVAKCTYGSSRQPPAKNARFTNGLIVIKNKSDHSEFGAVNKDGEVVYYHKKEEGSSDNYSEQLLRYWKRVDGKNRYGFLDLKGKIKIDPIWADALDFRNGMAGVRNNDGKWGYIDASGKNVLPCQWYRVSPFNEGVACVQTDQGWYGYINPLGEYVCEPIWANADICVEGMAAVKTAEGKWGFIRNPVASSQLATRPGAGLSR